MRKVAFILCILCNLSAFSQGSWERRMLPTTAYLHQVFFTDSLYGWICGDSGVMLHTVNGGATWEFQDLQTSHEVISVFFLNRNEGWASAFNYTEPPFGTLLFKTTDGGAHWQKYPYPKENIFITSIFYFDSLNGWMGGKPHAIVKTTDGGYTWTQAAVDTSTLAFFPVLTIQFYNRNYGYASGGIFDVAGVIWRTWNGGQRWYAMDASDAPADEVHGIHMFDSVTVMGAGGDPDFGYGVGMIRSWDGGENWEYEELDVQGNAYDLDFRSATEVWAPLGTRDKLIYSLDGGDTWSDMYAPDSVGIFSITFPDSLHGHAVGRNGAYLVYHPPVVPSTEDRTEVAQHVLHIRHFPNPVSRKSTFQFNPFGDEEMILEIFTLQGQCVMSSPASKYKTGIQDIEMDLEILPPGCYFYRLRSSNHGTVVSNTGKMIITKP